LLPALLPAPQQPRSSARAARPIRAECCASSARELRIDIPAEYETVTSRVIVSEGRMEWRPVLCETNASPAVVAQIQRALQKAGHNPGPIDGIVGRETLAAVSSYQQAKSLPRGGLNFETIDALGVSLAN